MSQIIDTRDLADELDELEARQDAVTAVDEDPNATDEDRAEVDLLDEAEAMRLSELRDLADLIGSEWCYGATMIPEADFEDYARDLAENMGAISQDAGWPHTCIDWAQAARELALDYTNVTWEGIDYLVR